jgi:hypothetical protein
MRLKRWYLMLLVAWALVGLPAFIVGWGFAGHAPWHEMPFVFGSDLIDPVSRTVSLLAWAFLLSPFMLAPFGIHRRHG